MPAGYSYNIFPLGDTALTIDWGNVMDEQINQQVLSLFHHIKNQHLSFITDIIPAYSSITICFHPLPLLQQQKTNTAFEAVAAIIKNMIVAATDVVQEKRIIKVPVCYAPQFALDMDEIMLQKKLSAAEIIQLHTAKTYRVYMVGFLPGFAYMGTVDERMTMPRKAAPRTNVAAGSVGIAGRQTGIYPITSPGGWQIIGKTPLTLFDKEAEEPVLFQPGDEVHFYPITEDEFKNY